MAGFALRRACPVCEKREHTVLRSLPFTAPEVWDFLERYYAGRIGRVELAGALYEIRRCAACGFLWQAYHLDADGMQRLYSWCRMAQAYGYTVAGFELSQRRRQHARAWGIRVIDSLSLERYDDINCHHALEHLADPYDTLARLVGVLAAGGLLRLSVPDGGDTEKALEESCWRAGKDPLHPLEHLNCFARTGA